VSPQDSVGVGRDLVVNAYRSPSVAGEVVGLRGYVLRGEDEIVAVQEEPHWRDVRGAVRPYSGQLARAGAFRDEGLPLVLFHFAHAGQHPSGLQRTQSGWLVQVALRRENK
jgi:hypothetical protein